MIFMAAGQAPCTRRFRSDATRLALFLLPIAYCAGIFAVAVHEVVGHGLTALAVGGEFRGFTLKWDGMGWASAWAAPNAPLRHHVLIFAGGILATTVSGVALLACSLLVRRHPHLQLTLLVLAMSTLLEGPPYAFWNSLHPSPPGDIAVILNLLRDAGTEAASHRVRLIGIVGGGLVSIGGVVVGSLLLFRAIEELLGRGRRFSGWQKLLAAAVFVALPGTAGWLMFDWNQIAEGIGGLPAWSGAASSILMAVLIYWKSLPLRSIAYARTTATHIAIAWALCIATIFSLTFFFSNGVKF